MCKRGSSLLLLRVLFCSIYLVGAGVWKRGGDDVLDLWNSLCIWLCDGLEFGERLYLFMRLLPDILVCLIFFFYLLLFACFIMNFSFCFS